MKSNSKHDPSTFIFSMDNVLLDFGGGVGVFDLNLSLPCGAILGMIDPNGCGMKR